MQLFQKGIGKQFATLSAQYQANKTRNAVRFQSQNMIWDYEESHYHTSAFSKGLASLSIGSGDNILIRLASEQQAEAYVAKVGSVGVNAQLLVSTSTNPQELKAQLQSKNIKALMIEPTLQLQSGESLIDCVYDLMPALKEQAHGAALNLSEYPSLRSIFQTNFYSYPGIYKFRSIMNYSRGPFSDFKQLDSFKPVSLPESENPLIVTNPAKQLAFRAGILNSVVNGRFLVCTEAVHLGQLCQVYGNRVDLIVEEELDNVPPEVRVIVEKGSGLLGSHSNRVEV